MQKIALLFTKSASEFKNLRSITLGACLIAIYAVSYSPFAGNFIIVPGIIEIRFGFIAIAVAAMMFGPAFAPVVAIVGDIFGTLLFYGGAFFWGFTISWAIQGFVFGLFFYDRKTSIPRTVLCMLFNTCVINLILTTKWEEMMGFGTFAGLFYRRLFINIFMFPVNTVLLFLVLRGIRSLRKKLVF